MKITNFISNLNSWDKIQSKNPEMTNEQYQIWQFAQKHLLKSENVRNLPELFKLRLVNKEMYIKINKKFLGFVKQIQKHDIHLIDLGFKNSTQALKLARTFGFKQVNMEGLEIYHKDYELSGKENIVLSKGKISYYASQDHEQQNQKIKKFLYFAVVALVMRCLYLKLEGDETSLDAIQETAFAMIPLIGLLNVL